MRWLPRFSIDNAVLVHMLILGLILMGTYAYMQLPRQLMSELAFNWVFLRVDVPGGPPEDMEQLIAIPLEEAMRNVDGVSSVTNRSKEGYAFFSVKFEQLSDEEFDHRRNSGDEEKKTHHENTGSSGGAWLHFSGSDRLCSNVAQLKSPGFTAGWMTISFRLSPA